MTSEEKPLFEKGPGIKVTCTVCGRSGYPNCSWQDSCKAGHPFVCLCGKRLSTRQGRSNHIRMSKGGVHGIVEAFTETREPDRHLACPSHCCPEHGCKYGYADCPIVQGLTHPTYPDNNGCEACTEAHGFKEGYEAGRTAVERLYEDAAASLSDAARYKVLRMAGSAHPCEVGDCRLSQEEHHRLAYGILAENRELKRRIQDLENGRVKVDD